MYIAGGKAVRIPATETAQMFFATGLFQLCDGGFFFQQQACAFYISRQQNIRRQIDISRDSFVQGAQFVKTRV